MARVLDAIDVLEAEHSRIRSLLARMASSKSPGADDRRALVAQVDSEFRIHASLQEDVLLPAFRKTSTNKDDARLTLEHGERRQFLDVALGWVREPRVSCAVFSARAKILKDLFGRHADEEVALMFPRWTRQLGDDRLLELGAGMLARRARLLLETAERDSLVGSDDVATG